MKFAAFLTTVFFATICLPSKYSFATGSQLDHALEDARSLHVKYLVSDAPGCEISRESLIRVIERELRLYAALKVVPELDIPDVFMTISVDIMAIPPGSLPVDACMYLVNLRTYHPMYGRYAYKREPHFMRALTFDRAAYSVIFPEKITDAVRVQAIRLLKMFFAAHGGS